MAEPIKAMIEEEPSFGYRTVAGLLGMNKNAVQRIFQLKGWQVRKRGGLPSADRGVALGRQGNGSTLGNGPVSGLGRARWLADTGLGHRLPHPAIAGLAAVAQRQGHDGCGSPGASL